MNHNGAFRRGRFCGQQDDPFVAEHDAARRRGGAGHNHDVCHSWTNRRRHFRGRRKERSVGAARTEIGPSGADHLRGVRGHGSGRLLVGWHGPLYVYPRYLFSSRTYLKRWG